MREHCPPQNVGRVFGTINYGKLEGSILSPDYCIVTSEGECTRHQGAKNAEDNDNADTQASGSDTAKTM